MNVEKTSASRREFLKNTGRIAAVSALANVAIPQVHAAEDNTIRVAVVGCGGRGTGAAANAMLAKGGPIKLVAMADIFKDHVDTAFEGLKAEHAAQMDVPDDRKFVGFDAYKHAMDCLRPGDIAVFATPPAFRWVHFGYAIEKGLNVFLEKPVTVDGPTSRRMLGLAEQAEKKGLKVAVGLMSRHARPLQELSKRIQGGDIGEPLLVRGYRMHPPVASFRSLPKPAGISELGYQIQRFHSFLWASGGCFSDYNIHIIDNCCWMKNAWPVLANAIGGRHYRQDRDGVYIDQNFDVYSVEYTFADGAKFYFEGRYMTGCPDDLYCNYVQGTKGIGVISKSGDCGPPSSTYKGHVVKKSKMIWQSKNHPEDRGPYQNEWDDFVDAIRHNRPYSEARRGIEASIVTSMGRMSAHTGRAISFEDMLNCSHEFAPNVDKLATLDSPAPLLAGPDGKYPTPQPGIVTETEY